MLGLLGFGCYQILWTTGLTQISAGDSALLVAASPVVVALLAAAVGMDRLTGPKLAGALIAFAGVAVVIGGSQALSLGSSLVGDALTLGAAVLWAVYTVGASRVVTRIDPLAASTWTVVAGPRCWCRSGSRSRSAGGRSPSRPPPSSRSCTPACSRPASPTCSSSTRSVTSGRPGRPRCSSSSRPGAVVLGAVFLAEPVGLPQVIGGAVIVLGVWLTRRASILPSAVRSRLSSAA